MSSTTVMGQEWGLSALAMEHGVAARRKPANYDRHRSGATLAMIATWQLRMYL